MFIRRFTPYILLIMCSACSSSKETTEPVLTSVSIIDRHGFSETISNPMRLQQYESVDFLSEQPYEKVLCMYSRDQCGNITSTQTSYHPNGQPKQYLEVVNNRACGTYMEWHTNGTLKLEANVINGEADITPEAQATWLFDGLSQVWDDCGNLVAQIPYCNGELEGESIYFHANGAIWKRENFHKNQYNGTLEVFRDTGEILQTTEYVSGEKQGSTKRYWSPDCVASEEIYCQNKLMTGTYFDSNGECLSAITEGNGYRVLFSKESISEIHEFRNGQAEGEIKIFAADGSLLNLYHIKNSIKHGEEIEYYNPLEVNGKVQPRLSLNWVEGHIQGLAKTWYPNGIQESQREMSNNSKSGLLSAWYQNGSLMLVEQYDSDKLIEGQYFPPGEKIPVSEIHNGRGTATLFDAKGNFIRKIKYNNSKPILD
jgi:antitoxin component YwqK of YwqJK toxin-antitoxin module